MSSSFSATHTLETPARADAIWALYDDVTSWPAWDADAERITRDGPFAAGTTGTMTFRGQPPLHYTLTSVEPRREWTDETPVGDLVVRVSHRLDPLPDGGTRLTYAAEIDGSADEARAAGAAITGDFPQTMAALAALAEERSA